MKKPTRAIWGVLGLVGWLGIGLGVAQAGVILPVDPTTRLPISSLVTVSIFQNGMDVTNAWLPEPGQTVQIVVNGLANPTISLVFDATKAANPIANATLTTSAYPGVCTNFGSDTGPDFTLVGSDLTSNDCGGMAVILVTSGGATYTFILPQDSDFDGMPDIWEATYCPAATPNCLAPAGDIDTGPGSNPNVGDGISNFDEYRGFIVSGIHVRTNPTVKDLFIHLVNPQCLPAGTDPLTSTASLLGGGVITYPTDGTTLFAAVNSLIFGQQIHVLGYTPGRPTSTTTEWVDNLVSLSINATGSSIFTYNASGSITDRQINKNAVRPLLDTITGRTIQKGLRITECLDTSVATLLGSAGFGSPNGPDNAIIYTRRIVNDINAKITAGAAKPLRYFTYVNGVAALRFTSAGAPTQADRDFIISKAIQFILAMEIGHSMRLTPTSSTYGYHHAPGAGSTLDQAIINTVDITYNSFYIPSAYNSTDQGAFKLRQ